MYEPTQEATWVQGIDLAREPDFDLGSLRVRPATCEVEHKGVTQTLQRRVMQVLVALADARGSVVSQEDLVVRCWHGLSVSEDAIYRCISKLRKLAADYPDTPYRIEAIPGVGYRLTSAGPLDSEGNIVSPSRPRIQRAIFAAAAGLAALLLAIIWIGHGRDSAVGEPMVVTVRPVGVLSGSEDARALARRIPNEVVNELGDSQIAAVLQDAGRAAPKSGLIVTGLLRDSARDVIVDVRVEDGATGAALWSLEFKRDHQRTSDLPSEVAARVADIVNMAIFARTAKPPLTDTSSLSALLQTTDMIRDPPRGAWAQMIENARSLVAQHPHFAFGHSVLASAYLEAADGIAAPAQAQVMRDAARQQADLTLKLDPEDAGAFAVQSFLVPRSDFRAQEAVLLRGIRYAKHPREPLGALYSYEGTLLSNVGRLREAIAYQLIAHATDEWGPSKTAKVALTYANMGNLPAARGWIQKAFERWPSHSGVRWVWEYIAGFYEPPANGLAMITAMEAGSFPDQGQAAIWRQYIDAKAGHAAKATAIREILEAGDRADITRENEVMMLAGLGRPELAIETADSVLDKQQQIQSWFLFTPVTRSLRQDPGFVSLAARMGLIKYWRETGKRPDFCTDRSMPNECSAELIAALRSN